MLRNSRPLANVSPCNNFFTGECCVLCNLRLALGSSGCIYINSIPWLLHRVSSIESRSSHPMASVLVDYAQSKSVEPKSDNVTEFQIYPGEGIYGEIDGESVYIGNKRILSRTSCETGWLHT